jgi:hypothetical protein
MGAFARIPLWVTLPCLAVSLVACGGFAFGVAGVAAARTGLLRQLDGALLTCASIVGDGSVATPGAGPSCGQPASGRYDLELLTATGQLLFPEAPPAAGSAAGPALPPSSATGPALPAGAATGPALPAGAATGPALPAGSATGPALPASPGWLAAHLGRPVTVPGVGSGGWRVLIETVHYQAQRILFVYDTQDVRFVIGGRSGPGPGGLLVVASGLAGPGRITARVEAGLAADACAVLVLLAAAALAVARAILRPIRLAAARLEALVPAPEDPGVR